MEVRAAGGPAGGPPLCERSSSLVPATVAVFTRLHLDISVAYGHRRSHTIKHCCFNC